MYLAIRHFRHFVNFFHADGSSTSPSKSITTVIPPNRPGTSILWPNSPRIFNTSVDPPMLLQMHSPGWTPTPSFPWIEATSTFRPWLSSKQLTQEMVGFLQTQTEGCSLDLITLLCDTPTGTHMQAHCFSLHALSGVQQPTLHVACTQVSEPPAVSSQSDLYDPTSSLLAGQKPFHYSRDSGPNITVSCKDG